MVRLACLIGGVALLIAAAAALWWRGRKPALLERPDSWRGIELSGPSLVRWQEAMVPVDARTGARGAPAIRIAVRYSLERESLGLEAGHATSLPPNLIIRIRHADGRVTTHSLEGLRQSRFFADTGLSPSWAMPPLIDVPAQIKGQLETDIGAALTREDAPGTIDVTAQVGSWSSNRLAIRLEP